MITLNNVSSGYNGKDVVFNINESFENGQFISIIGPNGSGKTTLIRAISNLLPYSGDILIDNVNITELSRKKISQHISLLTQISDSYFSYSVYETVMLGRYPYFEGIFSLPKKEDHLIVKNTLIKLGIDKLKDRAISSLSGGQLQRVFLARTIVQNPKIIILDEPTNHLDLKYQIEICDYVKEWCVENNKTVIAVLHDINLAMKYSDKMILLKEGKKVFSGNTVQVLKNEKINEIYDLDVVKWMSDSFKIWNR